jgi:hypothetical protein
MKKPTKDEKIQTLANALRGIIHAGGEQGIDHPAVQHAKDALTFAGEPFEKIGEEPQMSPNRVAAVFCEMHKAYFGINPRFDGRDRAALIEIAKMFKASEEVQFRGIVREYLDDKADPWMNGSDRNPPMMHAICWLNNSARIMRYEQAVASRDGVDQEADVQGGAIDILEGR